MKFRAFLVGVSLLFALSGCQQTMTSMRNAIGCEGVGALAAIGGGLLGSQIGDGSGRAVAVVAGAALGGLAGYQFCGYLTDVEARQLEQTTTQALNAADESDVVETEWSSPSSNARAKVVSYKPQTAREVLTAEALAKNNLPPDAMCRPTRTTVSAEGGMKAAGAYYCRNANGDYLPVQDAPSLVAQR